MGRNLSIRRYLPVIIPQPFHQNWLPFIIDRQDECNRSGNRGLTEAMGIDGGVWVWEGGGVGD